MLEDPAILDDAGVQAYRAKDTATKQKAVQGADFLPLVVDLSGTQTLGLAILNAVHADSAVEAQFSDPSDEGILNALISIAFVEPTTAVEILAYEASGTHKRTIAAGELTYLPFIRMYRNFITGPAATTLDIGFSG